MTSTCRLKNGLPRNVNAEIQIFDLWLSAEFCTSFSFIYDSHGHWTDAPATSAANIGGLISREPKIQVNVHVYQNVVSCPQRLRFSPGNLFWGSFTNHNTGNYLRHGINITTNNRFSPTFQGNRNMFNDSDSQTSPRFFPEGRGASVQRLD